MKTRAFADGTNIYREGGPSDAVFMVERGEVEVFKAAHDEQVAIAVLKRGDIFGEVGVIRNRRRGTTTRAKGDCRLLVIPKAVFLAAFGNANELALRVLNALCERLANADEQIVHRWTPPETVHEGAYKEIRLRPASETVEKQIGADGLVLATLPFRVGAVHGDAMAPHASESRLALHVHEKFQLSPSHFAVEIEDGNLVVADLGSLLGTLVNGVRVSGFERVNSAGLVRGENLVVAGGLDSPYRFTVTVS
ncbi:MAG: cyclic nucleotide-binding domain-containing protein [Alphaproteobacteria bacterium]|nr:cyclic nucleotide-binding domain-containing protein [Alphaproteobacteria bacterium]